MTKRTSDDLKAEMKKTMTLLQTLRDETKVKIHLAKLDVKAAWDELQPKLKEAERVAQSSAATASEAALEAMKQTAKELQVLAASL